LSTEDVEAVANTYSCVQLSLTKRDSAQCMGDIERDDFSLAPGRYVGTLNIDDESEP
jgi:hypothetical protein